MLQYMGNGSFGNGSLHDKELNPSGGAGNCASTLRFPVEQAWIDRNLLAYQADGNALPRGDGPFRIVVPGDKKQARWVREVSTIRVLHSKD